MPGHESLIPDHGGYRNLKSFQIARLIYDMTVRFCDQFIDKRSRTHDQMVQAARSGVQNIAEGSEASGTSKKMELKLTNVARASLVELRLDYEEFLRQRGLPQWPPNHPALMRFKALRCRELEEVRRWIKTEMEREEAARHGQSRTGTNPHGSQATMKEPPTIGGSGQADCPDPSVPVRESPCPSVPTQVYAANAALSLLNLCIELLKRQIEAQAKAFEAEGGFTERLYRTRTRFRRHRDTG